MIRTGCERRARRSYIDAVRRAGRVGAWPVLATLAMLLTGLLAVGCAPQRQITLVVDHESPDGPHDRADGPRRAGRAARRAGQAGSRRAGSMGRTTRQCDDRRHARGRADEGGADRRAVRAAHGAQSRAAGRREPPDSAGRERRGRSHLPRDSRGRRGGPAQGGPAADDSPGHGRDPDGQQRGPGDVDPDQRGPWRTSPAATPG